MSTSNNSDSILSLFHHIHHENGKHEVHHCGGKHVNVDPSVNYTIHHCSCQKHAIDKPKAIGHATDTQGQSISICVQFQEQCPEGGWHIESGVNLF